jgi:cytidylate kinase
MAVLSISRQFGAGGKTLGTMVAQRMGYSFLHEDILSKVAELANISPEYVEGMHKEAGGRLMRTLHTLVPTEFVERHVGDDKTDLDEKKLALYLSKVIWDVAEEGDAVVLGRGSQFILRDHPETVRCLLVASRSDRIQFIVDHYAMDRVRAEAEITKEERKRQRYMSAFYSGDPNDPSLYHMVVNTSFVDLESACNLICELLGATITHTAKPIW